jgi:hypothetical protein
MAAALALGTAALWEDTISKDGSAAAVTASMAVVTAAASMDSAGTNKNKGAATAIV